MTWISRIRSQFRRLFQSQDQPIDLLGFLGDRSGQISTSRVGYVYVTLQSGQIVQAKNSIGVPHVVNYKVILRRRSSGGYEITNVYDILPSSIPENPAIDPSASTWPGVFTVWVREEQILRGVPIPESSGFIVRWVSAGEYYLGKQSHAMGHLSIDLTGEVPETGAEWVNVEIDSSGAIFFNHGESATSRDVLSPSLRPAISQGRGLLFSVRLYAGQTKIWKTDVVSDIYDPRFARLIEYGEMVYRGEWDDEIKYRSGDVVDFAEDEDTTPSLYLSIDESVGSEPLSSPEAWMSLGGGGGGGTPGGSDKQVQYNDGGAFDGDPEFIWEKILKQLWIGGDWISGFLGKGIGIIAEGGTNDVARSRLFHFGTQTSGPGLTTGAAGGTRASPTATTNGKILGQWSIVSWYGDDEDSKKTIGYIRAVVTDDHATGDQPFQWEIYTCPSGSDTPTLAMTITSDGHINISSGKEYQVNGSQHQHVASDITSGTMATARLGSGTANGTTFLSGDQTYKQPNVPYASSNDIFRCDSPGGDSSFVGTIATLPGGSTLTYNVGSGNEGAMVPSSTSHLGKMRLYNTTRGTNALISNCVTGTSTLTLTATVPAGWQVGDTITIASQTVSGDFKWVDIELTDATLLNKSAISALFIHIASTAGYKSLVHPTETMAEAKRVPNTTQASGIQHEVTIPILKINSNLFSLAWNGSPTAVVLRVLGYIQ